MVVKHKVCSFFGHRNAELNDKQIENLKSIIEELIVKNNVQVFLFGSKSNFDSLCHKLVTKLKEKYPYIARICYTCKSECCILDNSSSIWEEMYKKYANQKAQFLDYEEEVEYKTKWTAGRASYVERNQAMINDSDFCIFYYDENYLPKAPKRTHKSLTSFQPNSGTALAYSFAKQKKKTIINIA